MAANVPVRAPSALVDSVTSRKDGRVRTYQLVPAGLDPAEHWLTTQHRLWNRRLDQLDTLLTTIGLTDPEESS